MKNSFPIFLIGLFLWIIIWYISGSQYFKTIATLSEISNDLQATIEQINPKINEAKKSDSCSIPWSWDTGSCAVPSLGQYEPWTVLVTGSLLSWDLIGKPSFLRRAGKFCAYCRDKIPTVETLLVDQLRGKINIQLMTMFYDTQKFSTRIPQSPFESFSFSWFTKSECAEFPMRVILDSNGKLITSQCGWWATIEEVRKTFDTLLK
jgi:hypothetical protein